MIQNCRLCVKLGQTREAEGISKHEEKIAHAEIHRRQEKFWNVMTENIDYFSRCFPPVRKNRGKKRKRDWKLDESESDRGSPELIAGPQIFTWRMEKSRSEERSKTVQGQKNHKTKETEANSNKHTHSIIQHCRKLFVGWPLKENRIRCGQCQNVITMITDKKRKISTRRLISHACMHFGKKLFHCRLCPKKTITESAMQGHEVHSHKLGENVHNYRSLVPEYEEEIIEMIDRCFKNAEPANSKTDLGQNMGKKEVQELCSQNIIRSRAGENSLLAERQIYSRILVQKYVTDWTIKCRICAHIINVKQNFGVSSQKAIGHATSHVNKPLYRCKRCQKEMTVMSAVYRHMKADHQIKKGIAKEYDDFSNEYHQELLKALTDCFDWEKKK